MWLPWTYRCRRRRGRRRWWRRGGGLAILVPLTGSTAEIGQSLLKGAQLSLAQAGSPPLDQYDTGGTADGAAKAARAALEAGAGVILGPLTAGETAAAAPIARAAGVPMLAFTSDVAQAQSGVWTLGVTPGQQMRRLILAVQAENKTRVVAVLPQNPFGDALAAGVVGAAKAAGMPEPRVVRMPGTFAALNATLKDVSGFATRRGASEAAQRAARGSTDADVKQKAEDAAKEPVAGAPFDALVLAASGDLLGQVVPLLGFYDIGPGQVRVLGPALWVRDAPRQPGLAGAWYAAPDPSARVGFEQQYAAKYGAPPREFSSLAYDAAGIARAVAGSDGFSVGGLTQAEGFGGADGLIALSADGQVRRGLAIFEIDKSGAHVVQPAPQSLSAPGV